jgi:dephospho-CoA kinase
VSGQGSGATRHVVGPRRRPGSGPTSRPLVIGLIGAIGTGKSTVAAWLAERGAVVINSDLLTREVMVPGSAVTDRIAAEFGPEFLRADGSLDRGALGRAVFSDPEQLARLESIVHPAVAELQERTMRAAAAAGAPVIVLEAIRLVEAGHAALCDEVWLVECDPAVQIARLIGRGMPEPDVRQRVAAQAESLPLWRSAATRVIATDGTLAETRAAVEGALNEALATRR